MLLDKPIWLLSTPEQKVILITMLLMVNHEDNEWEFKGEKFVCKPGQMITSLPSIAKTSGKNISIQNVRTALSRFEKYGFLTDESTTHGRLITICNWDSYQDQDQSTNREFNRRLTDAQQTPNRRLTANKNIKNIKNIKNDKNIDIEDKNIAPESNHTKNSYDLEIRKKSFMNDCAEWLEIYSKEMIRDFFDYWTEPNKSKTKMRFELQKTWDLSRRLRTWENNNLKFNKNGNTVRNSGKPNFTDEELMQSIASGIARGNAEREERIKEE